MNNKTKNQLYLNKNRLVNLSDGIFAFAMTLLVIELAVPIVPKLQAVDELPLKLIEMWPKFLAFAVSFLVMGIIWFNHHYQFHYIKRSNGLFVWLNIFLLMFIVVMPFSTALIGEYHIYSQTAIVFYGVNSLIIILFCNLIWWYATSNKRLVVDTLEKKLVIKKRIILLAIAGSFSIAIGLSFINPYIGISIYILTALFGIIFQSIRSD